MRERATASFYDLVGAGEDRGRKRDAERLGGLQIDSKFVMRGSVDRQLAGQGAAEDARGIIRGLPEHLGRVRAVAHQAALLRRPEITKIGRASRRERG